jgi:signal transduction histidine kinase
LVAAKGYVDYLLDGQMGELNKEQNHSLTITQTKLQRVVDIIEVMTTLHEAATPRELKPIDLNKVADQTVMRFLRAAKRADIVLEAKLSKDPAIVEADPRQITQVFDHLLTNAIKFSPEGGLIQVTVDTADPAKIHFSVKDTGIGISKMHLSKVFERFYQVDGSTTRRFGGVGIGLALVREIIRAHGGSVRVESEIKRGSTFHCALPRARS